MKTMIFGKPSRFAIESELDPPSTEYPFGKIRLWAAGKPLGDYSQTVILTVPADHLRALLGYSGNRQHDTLGGMPGEQVLHAVEEVLYGDGSKTIAEALALAQQYALYCVCPGGGEAFDGELAVIVKVSGATRFIWRDFNDQQVYEVRLLPGEFETTAHAFLNWLPR